MNLDKTEIRIILADIYKDACILENIDMRELAFVLEGITETLLEFPVIEAWNKINIDKLLFDKQPYINVIVDYREKIIDCLKEKIVAHINQQITVNKEEAFKIWVDEYTDALVNWQGNIFCELCTTDFDFSESEQKKIQHFQHLNNLILDDKWFETFDYFNELAENENFNSEKRSRFLVYAGQVMLFHIGNSDRALNIFNKANSLHSGSSLVISAFGQYELQNKNFEKARTYFLNAISMDKSNVTNYCNMGDVYKEEEKLNAAEQWYNDAKQINFLDTLPYSKTILLFGNEEIIESKKEYIDNIIEKIVLLDKNRKGDNSLYNGYKNAGLVYYQTKRYKQATEYYMKAMELKPVYTSAMIDLAYILAYDKKYDESEKLLLKALKADKTHSDFYVFWGLGWLYSEMGEILKSIEEYKKCINLRKFGNERIYNLIGNIYFNNSFYAESIPYYKEAIAENPSETVFFDNLENAIEKTGDINELEKFYVQLANSFPGKHDYLNKIGIFYYDQKNYEKAIKFYSEALKLEQLKPVYWSNRALAYESLQKFAEAEIDYENAIKLEETADYYNSLGVVNFKQLKFIEARNNFQNAINIENNYPLYYENLGHTFEKLYDSESIDKLDLEESINFNEAVKNFKKAIELSKEDPIYYNRLGLFYSNHAMYPEALEMYKKASEKDLEDLIYKENVAFIYEKLGEYKKAEKLYKQIVLIDENEKVAHLGILSSQLSQKKYEQVITTSNKLFEKYPQLPELYEYKGIALENLYLYKEALEVYKEALLINPLSEYFNNRAGIMHYYLGSNDDLKAASEFYQKAIEINPHFDTYYRNLELVYQKLDNLEAYNELKTKLKRYN